LVPATDAIVGNGGSGARPPAAELGLDRVDHGSNCGNGPKPPSAEPGLDRVGNCGNGGNGGRAFAPRVSDTPGSGGNGGNSAKGLASVPLYMFPEDEGNGGSSGIDGDFGAAISGNGGISGKPPPLPLPAAPGRGGNGGIGGNACACLGTVEPLDPLGRYDLTNTQDSGAASASRLSSDGRMLPCFIF